MFYSFSAGIDFRRQNLTSKVDPRAERVKALKYFTYLFNLKSDPALKGLIPDHRQGQYVKLMLVQC